MRDTEPRKGEEKTRGFSSVHFRLFQCSLARRCFQGVLVTVESRMKSNRCTRATRNLLAVVIMNEYRGKVGRRGGSFGETCGESWTRRVKSRFASRQTDKFKQTRSENATFESHLRNIRVDGTCLVFAF